jgi:hypothetical protein
MIPRPGQEKPSNATVFVKSLSLSGISFPVTGVRNCALSLALYGSILICRMKGRT